MQSARWILAAVVMLGLGMAAPAQADHAKGHHHGKGKWECPYKNKKGRDGMEKSCPFSPEKREVLHGAMKKAHTRNEALRKDMMKHHKAMESVLAAKDFNKKAFLATFDKASGVRAQMMRNKAKAFADVAGQLTPEERKKAAMFLAGGMHHHKGMMMRHGMKKYHQGLRASGSDWSNLNQ